MSGAKLGYQVLKFKNSPKNWVFKLAHQTLGYFYKPNLRYNKPNLGVISF